MGILRLEFFFLALTSCGKMWQNISSCISLILSVIDLKMILGEFLGLSDWSRTQILGIYKLLKIFVIIKDKIFKFATFQILVPSFKNLNYGHRLLVVCFVPSLCQNYFSEKKKSLEYFWLDSKVCWLRILLMALSKVLGSTWI